MRSLNRKNNRIVYFNNFIQKVKLPFRKDKELYRRLYSILGFYPQNIEFYKQALMHKSMNSRSKDGHRQHNERLEFLGDAILDAVVGDIVYRRFSHKPEGFLTNTRSKLVQRETLGKLAVEMGLDKLIQFNHTKQQNHNSYMAGNAFEALVGAIYLDYGYEQCMKFMEKRILGSLLDIDKVAYKEVNFKSKLLEWSQKNRIRMNFKDKESRNEKDGATIFHTIVIIEGLDCGRGKGYSKKESQQNAARETLLMLKKEKGFEERVFEAKSQRTAMEEQPEALLPDIPEELLSNPVPKDKQERTDKPAKQERTDKPAKQEKTDKPAKQERTDKPAKQEKTDKPAKQEKADKSAKQERTDKPAKQERTDKPAKQEKSDKPAKQEKADKPAKQERTDKPAKQEKTDKPTKQEKADKPAKQEKADKPAKQEQTDKPAKQEHTDKPAKQEHTDKSVQPEPVVEPVQPEQVVESVDEASANESAGDGLPRKKTSRRGHRRSSRSFGDAKKVAAAPSSDTSSQES